MDDGDGCFDLDNLEHASDFRAPTDHSSGEAVAMIPRHRAYLTLSRTYGATKPKTSDYVVGHNVSYVPQLLVYAI